MDFIYAIKPALDGNLTGAGKAMHVSLTEAKVHLADFIRRAKAGEDVILTRHGQPAVRLVLVKAMGDRAARRKLLEQIRLIGAAKATGGADAAHSQDFLYDKDGLPA